MNRLHFITLGLGMNDLYALSAGFPAEMFVGPGDVHFTPEGAERLAKQVAEVVEEFTPPMGGQQRDELGPIERL
jgi:hypothetical protein